MCFKLVVPIITSFFTSIFFPKHFINQIRLHITSTCNIYYNYFNKFINITINIILINKGEILSKIFYIDA